MNYLDKISSMHPDIISGFLKTGRSESIPIDLQLFIKQIQWAAEIYEYERNITRAAKLLRTRILAQQNKDIDERTCKSRIYSAINYFSVDNNVSIRVWEEVYADRYSDMEKIAIFKGDYKTAKLCADAALECHRKASQAAEIEKDWAPVFLISTDITPDDLGFSKKKLKDIAAKANEGFYIRLIDSLPIESEDRKRLLFDAQIEDIPHTEIESD